ncbi:hypothetical protein [Streptomyces sp. ALI-76-A]|jgi:hypothetical protein|uniref:hypothetical protein n=1 Tax=Streptomyces sp. ALI-76-A TaxID=3025736 RepID=UPI00256F1F9F|nr:hypothetical protein [Streptomyces sp. ALI-76-A]MDL5204489.1 hypothetical protein [Streptomyces sp. ALI-76-A]
MKQRGRHRRQKRGRALRAFLAGTALALTGAATMISASQATADRDPGALKPLSSADGTTALRLRHEPVPEPSLDRLAASMGRPVGVDAVLADADRPLRDAASCTGAERTALPVEPAATRAYCWDTADTRSWRPGAVTTSGDADDDGVWGHDRVILSGWAQDDGTDGRDLARVAFVDANDLGSPRYTWVLLAVPVEGGRDYRPLASRLSGMVWYQDKLLVTADDQGQDALYVYDLNRVQRTTVAAEGVGRVPGGWSAHGSRFVMPAVASYRLAGADAAARPQGISLDRTTAPDSLVASERPAFGSERPARLWRYAFSTDKDTDRTGLLATDAAGRAAPTEAYETDAADIGGVLSYRSDWYVARASGSDDEHGSLWRQTTDGARVTRCGSDERLDCWSPQTPSLSYWEESGEVWAQSGRVLYALPLTSIDRALE